MKILLYGRLAEAIGREIEVAERVPTVGELRDLLIKSYPPAADILRRSRAVAANSLIGEDAPLSQIGIIELLPPVCGG